MFRKAQNSTGALRIASKKASKMHRFPLVFDTCWLHFSRPQNSTGAPRIAFKNLTKSDEKRIDFHTGTMAIAHSENSSENSGILDTICDSLSKIERFFISFCDFLPPFLSQCPESRGEDRKEKKKKIYPHEITRFPHLVPIASDFGSFTKLP